MPAGDKTTVFITICACNYLGFASTLGCSVKEHHPDARFVIWLIDAVDPTEFPTDLDVRFASDVLGQQEYDHLLMLYNVRELATAVKPRCLAAELNAGADYVIYLDPDILVFRPLAAIFELLNQGASGVLTPHVMYPLPRDGRSPDDLNILVAGVYNLGFLALSDCDEAQRFLEWWGVWLGETCFEDTSAGIFTDQKWVNFAPIFWPGFQLLRDPSYNVAYWNLPQRDLTQDRNGWLLDGQALTFFHFSGFDPDQPGQLSKHQDRLGVPAGSALSAILRHYAECLFAAGHKHWRQRSFPDTCFENGVALDDICRKLYLHASEAEVSLSEPLLATGRGSLFEWITSPVRHGVSAPNRVTRYMYQVYLQRPDVMKRYPNIFGTDGPDFVDWLSVPAASR